MRRVSRPALPVAIPGEIATIATDVPRHLFSDSFRGACERFDLYVGTVAAELAAALDLPTDTPVSAESLTASRGWLAEGTLALRWLLETLAVYGLAEADDRTWMLRPLPAPAPSSSELRRDAVAALPETEPAYRVFELCATALGPVLRGEARGEDALFSPASLGLWFDYFSNENPHYALNNTLAATALCRVLGPDARILEVGGGGGSAALAALAALVGAGRPPARYTFTELHPAFLRRGARAVHAAAPVGCTVTSMRLDIDGDPAAQQLDGAEFDAVLAVNTLHLGRDLVAVLARLRSLLRRGGALVLGELLRPHANAPVHLELPFTLLDAYRRVPLIAGVRERPGFLALDGWTRALLAAGFAQVSVVPRAFRRCIELYPGFYCGAITAIA
jgi:SAM-dependent methyltransferase